MSPGLPWAWSKAELIVREILHYISSQRSQSKAFGEINGTQSNGAHAHLILFHS